MSICAAISTQFDQLRISRSEAIAATTAATAAAFTRTRDVHLDRAAVEHLAVEAADRCLGFLLRAHLDERKAARAARVAIRDDRCARDCAKCRERLSERLFG